VLLQSYKSVLHPQSQVFGLLVWTLIGGTEYLHVPALGWVMFVSVLCWVLTVILFLLYLTTAHTRIPQIPWTILVSKLELQINVTFFNPTFH